MPVDTGTGRRAVGNREEVIAPLPSLYASVAQLLRNGHETLQMCS